MGCTDFHDCGRGTYCLALALYKIQFEEIWYLEITNIAKEPKVFGRGFMQKSGMDGQMRGLLIFEDCLLYA